MVRKESRMPLVRSFAPGAAALLPAETARAEEDSSGVKAHCMGGFSLSVGGRQVRRWHAGKARSLFQYLLINRGRVVLRERLYEVLWPDQEWTPGSSSLKVAAHALRRMLAEQPRLEGSDPIRIEHRDFGYVLSAGDIWVDAERLQSAASEARAAALRGDHETATARYRRVADLYRGDYLAGETADWVCEQREWYRSLALRAFGYLRDRALEQGDYPEVIERSRQCLAVDRFHEETYQALMIAHGCLGELDRVKGWHELCVRRLGDELDLTPSPETGRILTQALHDRPRAGRTAPVAAAGRAAA